jgi:hypothetical protein
MCVDRSLGLGVGEQTGCLEQPGVIGLTARTASEMDRRSGMYAGRVIAGQLEFDIRVENLLARGATDVSILRAEQFAEGTIGHVVASVSSRTG